MQDFLFGILVTCRNNFVVNSGLVVPRMVIVDACGGEEYVELIG